MSAPIPASNSIPTSAPAALSATPTPNASHNTVPATKQHPKPNAAASPYTTPSAATPPHSPPAIMAHLVLGYPTIEHTLPIATALADGGAAALELQIPFSDPIADGADIERACHTALAQEERLQPYLELAHRIAHKTALPCYCMSYVTIPYRIGIPTFIAKIKDAGMHGIIIPDLPFDHDEGLRHCCHTHHITPVIVSMLTISPTRFQHIIDAPHCTVYIALRSGITGQQTALHSTGLARLQQLRQSGKKILAGFGITTSAQVRTLAPLVDYTVVGTHLLRTIAAVPARSPIATYQRTLQSTMRTLLSTPTTRTQ